MIFSYLTLCRKCRKKKQYFLAQKCIFQKKMHFSLLPPPPLLVTSH
nr:MAG TPA: hypothetical protein [Caudoviricetes sp.]